MSNADPLSSETHYHVLKFLQDHPEANQRELATLLGVSLGKLNYCIRALIEKGWVKIGNFARNPSKKGYVYLLTPQGIEARARLTRLFLHRKMAEYDRLRQEIEALRKEVEPDSAPASVTVQPDPKKDPTI